MARLIVCAPTSERGRGRQLPRPTFWDHCAALGLRQPAGTVFLIYDSVFFVILWYGPLYSLTIVKRNNKNLLLVFTRKLYTLYFR